MPSDKRQRQREASRARQQAVAAAQQRSKSRRRMAFVVVLVLLFGGAIFWATQGGDDETDLSSSATTTTASNGRRSPCPPKTGAAERTTTFPGPPRMCIDAKKKYTALVKTDVGDVEISLLPKTAPQTVNSFVFLARHKFYEGVTFHRVLKNFMIQGGDPQGTGSGGPGYTIPDEFSPKHEFKVGDVAMAKTSAPDSGGSQFFVVIGPQGESLPPQYTYFGRVTKGLEVVRAIEADGADADPNPPAVLHRIVSVNITEE